VVPDWTTVCGAGLWVSTVWTTLTVVDVSGGLVVVVVVDGTEVEASLCGWVVVVVAGSPTEKQAQVRPTPWIACRAAEKDSPTTAGTSGVPASQPDQLIPSRVPGATVTPGCNGTAPTVTSGGLPGMASETTTLWLANVPLLHGVFKFTDVKPALRRAPRAAAILRPMTLGMTTPGCDVVAADDEVAVVGGGFVVVVVRMSRTAFFCAAVGPLPHEARTHAVASAVRPSAVDRPPNDMGPLWFVQSGGAAPMVRSAYLRMLTARATTRMATTREMASSAIIMSFIQGFTADTSVGLKAVAVAKAKWK
jgi:hypothetical protein